MSSRTQVHVLRAPSMWSSCVCARTRGAWPQRRSARHHRCRWCEGARAGARAGVQTAGARAARSGAHQHRPPQLASPVDKVLGRHLQEVLLVEGAARERPVEEAVARGEEAQGRDAAPADQDLILAVRGRASQRVAVGTLQHVSVLRSLVERRDLVQAMVRQKLGEPVVGLVAVALVRDGLDLGGVTAQRALQRAARGLRSRAAWPGGAAGCAPGRARTFTLEYPRRRTARQKVL